MPVEPWAVRERVMVVCERCNKRLPLADALPFTEHTVCCADCLEWLRLDQHVRKLNRKEKSSGGAA